MKAANITKWIIPALFVGLSLASCSKDDDKDPSNGKDCFTCQNCEGQYSHLMNIEYCVDGFDNRGDWLDAKKQRENTNNCDCEFN
jgi:hypothetical protein